MNVGAILTGGLGVFGSANLLITLGYHAGEPPVVNGDDRYVVRHARAGRGMRLRTARVFVVNDVRRQR